MRDLEQCRKGNPYILSFHIRRMEAGQAWVSQIKKDDFLS